MRKGVDFWTLNLQTFVVKTMELVQLDLHGFFFNVISKLEVPSSTFDAIGQKMKLTLFI